MPPSRAISAVTASSELFESLWPVFKISTGSQMRAHGFGLDDLKGVSERKIVAEFVNRIVETTNKTVLLKVMWRLANKVLTRPVKTHVILNETN